MVSGLVGGCSVGVGVTTAGSCGMFLSMGSSVTSGSSGKVGSGGISSGASGSDAHYLDAIISLTRVLLE